MTCTNEIQQPATSPVSDCYNSRKEVDRYNQSSSQTCSPTTDHYLLGDGESEPKMFPTGVNSEEYEQQNMTTPVFDDLRKSEYSFHEVEVVYEDLTPMDVSSDDTINTNSSSPECNLSIVDASDKNHDSMNNVETGLPFIQSGGDRFSSSRVLHSESNESVDDSAYFSSGDCSVLESYAGKTDENVTDNRCTGSTIPGKFF
ncbi:hypothetical protein QAD02_003227 [Eretmocerus hayati]|uniref:Uncharacterized protein n=1 Tax=Eretmocerus hayati TaxID=131215 RepID=A0ACC2NM66_9HYME|nr:hypothetical protein QAD02_003227 [Eretmocerus hayati]